MYGLWILCIAFTIVTAGAFLIGGLSYPIYKKYKEQTCYSYQYREGYWDTDYYTGHSRDKKYIKEEDIPKYEKAYKKKRFWSKLSDYNFVFYIIGTFLCIATVILLCCSIFVPLCSANEVAYWSEFAPMVENLIDNSTGYQDVGITSKIVEYNSWLAQARSSQEIYGNWSSYYGIDLSQLQYIQIGQ